mmetsp:Transcript_25848/g.61240  ORF Transcript_25848/g.61240 Transcript_25848/m.61240 type:complete len:89 (-) Transcript_25848:593-859(-)
MAFQQFLLVLLNTVVEFRVQASYQYSTIDRFLYFKQLKSHLSSDAGNVSHVPISSSSPSSSPSPSPWSSPSDDSESDSNDSNSFGSMT